MIFEHVQMWWHHFLFCFCFSAPQFDQDNLKKSSKPSRLDDIHGFHRGRRQSGQGQSPFYYWEDQSINHSINQSINQPEFFERWKQIFVTCFKDLSRFKYKLQFIVSLKTRQEQNTSPDFISVLSHLELDSSESSGEALEDFSFSGTAERSCESVNHIWLTNSPTFILWIYISEMFFCVRKQKTETSCLKSVFLKTQ